MHVNEAVKSFLHYCETIRKLSAHTLRAYRLDLERFTTIVGCTEVAACDKAMIYAYIEQLFATYHLREASVRRHLASVRALFRWLHQEGIIGTCPFAHATFRITVPKRLPRILTRSELRTLLAAPSSTFEELSAAVAIELLFATGMRVAELAALSHEDIDLGDGVITVIGKGDRQRRVFINDEARPVLNRYLHERASRVRSAALIINKRGGRASTDVIRRMIRNRATALSLTRRVTPHMIRHSTATYLLEEGVDVRYVQRLLGHRSITTTEIYTHVADGALKSRVTEHHPRRGIVAGA